MKGAVMNDNHIYRENQAESTKTMTTNRPTNRDGEQIGISGSLSEATQSFGGGSSVLRTEHSPRAPLRKLNRSHLVALDERLSDRDRNILRSIGKHRFLLSGQIERLYFTDGTTPTANTRAANRAMKKLKGFGLVAPLKRRIGGVRAGSASLIWHLTEPGQRILHLNDNEDVRKRFEEPSPKFLAHILAVAECAVQIECICHQSFDLETISLDPEPTCWRTFMEDGRTVQLRPDLFAATAYDEYEDDWFIEMDLGTESTAQVVEKCKTYRRYYYTGIEQQKLEVFPLVVWIVPDAARKERIKEAIKAGIPPQPKMFLVITPDELKSMLRQDIDKAGLC